MGERGDDNVVAHEVIDGHRFEVVATGAVGVARQAFRQCFPKI